MGSDWEDMGSNWEDMGSDWEDIGRNWGDMGIVESIYVKYTPNPPKIATKVFLLIIDVL